MRFLAPSNDVGGPMGGMTNDEMLRRCAPLSRSLAPSLPCSLALAMCPCVCECLRVSASV
eukprot:3343090-Rhodomonas_salina.1